MSTEIKSIHERAVLNKETGMWVDSSNSGWEDMWHARKPDSPHGPVWDQQWSNAYRQFFEMLVKELIRTKPDLLEDVGTCYGIKRNAMKLADVYMSSALS